MKVHSKTDAYNSLKEFVIEKEKEFQKKIVLGKELYKLLGEGLVSTEALPNDMQETVNLYMKQCNTVDHMDAELKPWQKELLELISSPKFQTKKLLYNHVQSIHLGEKTNCPDCKKDISVHNFSRHVRETHERVGDTWIKMMFINIIFISR